MTIFFIVVLMLECLVILSRGLAQRERMIQFPFLAAAVFLGWMLPQLVGLTRNPSLPQGGLEKTTFMAILCLAACWCGYGLNIRPAKLFWWQFDRTRLLCGSAAMSLLGAFFYYKVGTLAPDAAGSAWTGIITVYTFFSKLLTFGMVLAWILYLVKPSRAAMLILAFDLLFYLDRIVIKGRRAAMVELGLMVLLGLWFHRRWLAPKWTMVLMLIMGTLLINSIGDYRRTMLEEGTRGWSGAGVSDILSIDYFGNLRRLIHGEAGNYDLTNAVMNIEAVDSRMSLDFGLSHWNALVFSYVPAQFVGVERKEALMIDYARIGTRAAENFGYSSAAGSTPTGLSDAFQSFWYFGAINFYLIGLIMSRWYVAALHGNVVAQVILLLVVSSSLHAITHSTHWFLIEFVQLGAFLMPVLLAARVKHPIALPYGRTPQRSSR